MRTNHTSNSFNGYSSSTCTGPPLCKLSQGGGELEEAEEEGDQLYGAGVLRGRRARPQDEDEDDRCRRDADGDRAAGLPRFPTTSLAGTDRRCSSGASEWNERRPEAAAAPPVQCTDMWTSDALRVRRRRRRGRRPSAVGRS